MIRRHSLALMVLCVLAMPYTVNANSKNDLQPKYQCPPCGCAHDSVTFHVDGHCPTCNMPLVQRMDGFMAQLQDNVAPAFQNSTTFTPLYHKLIFPAFVIGILVSLFVLFRSNQLSLVIFPSLVMLSLALFGIKNQLWGVPYSMDMDSKFLHFPLSFITIIGPCIYFHARMLQNISPFFSYRDLWHFVPATVFLGFQLLLFLGSCSVIQSFMYTPFSDFFSQFEQVAFVVSVFIYGWLARKTEAPSGEEKQKSINTLVVVLYVLATLWGMILGLNFFLYEMSVTTLTYNPLWLMMAFCIYYLSYYMLFQSGVFTPKKSQEYNQRLAHEVIGSYKVKLNDLMKEQKLYMEHELSLNGLAQRMELSAKDLSEVLNKGFRQNFYEYVNGFRIEEVKQMLLDPKFQHLTNTAIASEAGFRSRSTFLSTFKKTVKMTPKEYKKKFSRENS